jgi:hypothetical protein
MLPNAENVSPVEDSIFPAHKSSEEHGLTGSVLLGFCDLVQMLSLNRCTKVVNLFNQEQQGVLWFKSGEIVHAVCGDTVGHQAVATLLSWEEGGFRIEPWREPVRVTISESVQQLLLECCCWIDENQRSPSTVDETLKEGSVSNLKESMESLAELDGFVGVCIVDSNSGMMLGSLGGGNVNLEVAAAGNTEVVRAKRKTMKALGLNDAIEDMLITLGKQYHLIRPLAVKEGLFLYLVLDRVKSNLALGRHRLGETEGTLSL